MQCRRGYQLKEASVADANATPPTIGTREPTTHAVGACKKIKVKNGLRLETTLYNHYMIQVLFFLFCNTSFITSFFIRKNQTKLDPLNIPYSLMKNFAKEIYKGTKISKYEENKAMS